MSENPKNEFDTRTVPDPSYLTTQQLHRKMATLRELLEARLDGMDHAASLLQASTDRLPTQVAQLVGQLQQVQDEKFKGIATQFKERDTRSDQNSRDQKVAVDVAILVVEKAVGKQNEFFSLSIEKSEKATAKQIDQQSDLLRTSTKALDDKVSTLDRRLERIEGIAVGQATQAANQQTTHTNSQGASNLTISLVMGAVGIIALILSIIVSFRT